MVMTVYLAGPITGLAYAGAVDWRKQATTYLAQFGIRGVSPMRAKEYLANEHSLDAKGYANPLSTPQGVLARDRWDCTHSDLVLFNLAGARQVSIGTAMEVAWADLARVPSVLVLEEGGLHDHMMVTGACGWRAATLEDGLDLVVAVMRGSGVDRGVRGPY